MENLPPYLLKAIEGACSMFSNVTFSIHGDINKTRISIMFDEGDSNKLKRKSKSTVHRDNKRLEKFIEKKGTEIEVVDNELPVAKQTLSHIVDNEIDIVDSVATSDIDKHTHITSDLDINESMMVCDDDEDKSGDVRENDANIPHVVLVENNTQEILQHETCTNNIVLSTVENWDDDSIQDQSIVTTPTKSNTGKGPCNDSPFEKIVHNRVKIGYDIIGKIKGKNTVVVRSFCVDSGREYLRHFDKDIDQSGYNRYIICIEQCPDMRESGNRMMRKTVKVIPRLEDYAKRFRLSLL